MKLTALTHFHTKSAADIRSQFLNAFPVIIFFLLMYYAVLYLFGMQYSMVVSLATLLFQVNYKKQHNASSLAYLVIQQLILVVLAYIATLNLACCLILNLIVPFWLIFSKTSPFNQLGYFSTLMTFTFLQFMPLNLEGFFTQLGAMLFCCGVLFIAIPFYSRLHPEIAVNDTEKKSMAMLGTVLEKTLDSDDTEAEMSRLFELQRALYQEAYQYRGRKHVVTSAGKLKYMFALLMQRAVYFVSGQSQILSPKDEKARIFARKLAAFMKDAGEKDFMNGETKELMLEGRRLFREADKEQEDFYRASADFIRMFLLILHQQGKKHIVDQRWEVPVKQRFLERFLYRMRPDTFEMRFAMRMSVVLMLGLSFNMISGETHSYWFVMNAFLLLRPMYEDSNYRMKTRFLGTACGCVIVALVTPLFSGYAVYLAFAGIMVACMYTATPGTIVHAVFVTCFALTMTTLSMGQTATAVFLRMIYIIAAVLFVLVINRFFFPTSMGSQFRYNFEMLFHMHHMYLRILEDSLTDPLDYWRICDAQIQYHMIHAQIRQDIPKTAEEGEEDYYLKILSITWRMASEVQQMIFHVKHHHRGIEARETMEQYIYCSDYILNQIQDMMQLKKEKKLHGINIIKYSRHIEKEPELSRLMTQYAQNLSELYLHVLRKSSAVRPPAA